MPARLNLFTARRAASILRQPYHSSHARAAVERTAPSLCIRSRPIGPAATQQRRLQSNGALKRDIPEDSIAERPKGPTEDPLPSAPEEAAAVGKVLSGKKCDGTLAGTPEEEQGTPVDEIFRRDQEAMKYAPKVFQNLGQGQGQGQGQGPSGSRSYSTSARLHQQELQKSLQQDPNASAAGEGDKSVEVVANMISRATEQAIKNQTGFKFHMPPPLPRTENVRSRYDPVVEQFTKLMMRDGKLSVAQKNMSIILDHLRASAPPKIDPRRPLQTALPPPQLPLNPILYLNLIVDSVSPLIKIRQQKGLVGGGASVPVPVPLAQRQRRRTAIKWIIDASDKRKDTKFATRVAHELIAVAEGRSGVWEKREQVHRTGVAGRSNLQLKPPGNFR